MMKFIGRNDFSGRKIALFGTSGGNAGMEVDLMVAALKHKGATVLGSYHCKVKAFLLFSTTLTRKTCTARESLPERRLCLVDLYKLQK